MSPTKRGKYFAKLSTRGRATRPETQSPTFTWPWVNTTPLSVNLNEPVMNAHHRFTWWGSRRSLRHCVKTNDFFRSCARSGLIPSDCLLPPRSHNCRNAASLEVAARSQCFRPYDLAPQLRE